MIKPIAKLTIYNCKSLRVIDGDSFVAVADISPLLPDASEWLPHIRIFGVDSAERGEANWAVHRSYLSTWATGGEFNLICYGREKYGRLLADAERGTGLLSEYLIGFGTPKLTENKAKELVSFAGSRVKTGS